MSTSSAILSDDAIAPQAQYGITEWHDTDEIYVRLKELVKQPIRPIRREAMEPVLDYFKRSCAGSKRVAEEAEAVIPGGVQHNLAFNYPFPLTMVSAQGAHLPTSTAIVTSTF